MNKKEIKDYLKRVDELETKITGENKETYAWLIYGYNQCAKLLNETEQKYKKQKEVIDKLKEYISSQMNAYDDGEDCGVDCECDGFKLLDILKEVE